MSSSVGQLGLDNVDTWQLALGAASLALLAFLTWHFLTYGNNNGLFIFPVVGITPQLVAHSADLFNFFTRILEKSPTMLVFGAVPGFPWYFTANPEHIQYILKDNFKNYPKGEDFRDMLTELLGQGIFNSDGEAWFQQRKIASFEFSTNSLRKMMMLSFHSEIQKRLLPTLESLSKQGGLVDMQDVFLRYTLDSICKIAFGVDLGALSEDFPTLPFTRSFDRASKNIVFRSFVPSFYWKLLRFFRLGSEGQIIRDIKVIDEWVKDVVVKRKEDIETRREMKGSSVSDEELLGDHVDLLSRMVALGERDHGNLFDDRFLRDACLNFVIAGRDTSAVALTWLFWLLSHHPDVERKILEELEGILRKRQRSGPEVSDAPFSFDELKEMHYTQAAIQEALRLYPPVPVDFKQCKDDDVFPDGTRVGRGWRVSYVIYAVGRMTRVWGPDAAEFKPERWLTAEGLVRAESPFKFLAFNGGPRLCLGREMAYMQVKSVAGSILRRYHLELKPGHKVTFEPSITFLMKTGLPMTIRSRERQL